MKRRTLDTIFAGGGLLIAALLAVLGLVLAGESAFAVNYVKEELGAQKIAFPAASALTKEDLEYKPGSTCLTTYAGQLMTTGPMAECYAKYYIRHHMNTSTITAGVPGATYATVSPFQAEQRAAIAAANKAGNKDAAAAAQKKLDTLTALRTTLQSGEGLAGMLLTVYGFSVLGAKAGLAANVLFALAGLMVFLSAAGFVHAWVTPKNKMVFAPVGVGARAPSGA